uniref:Putative ovule protein n=1 Tax=Solanum chacoense TaxID=4108 RepID=A0A0V0IHU1_SOLCH
MDEISASNELMPSENRGMGLRLELVVSYAFFLYISYIYTFSEAVLLVSVKECQSFQSSCPLFPTFFS